MRALLASAPDDTLPYTGVDAAASAKKVSNKSLHNANNAAFRRHQAGLICSLPKMLGGLAKFEKELYNADYSESDAINQYRLFKSWHSSEQRYAGDYRFVTREVAFQVARKFFT